MSKYHASQKLWKVVKELDDYYYEIRLAGIIVDRVKVDEPALKYLKSKGVLEKEPPLYEALATKMNIVRFKTRC